MAVVCALMPAVAGCLAVSAGANVVSLIATDRTITDHVVSLATGEDCSIVGVSRGKPYCVDPDAPPPEQPVYHCYRTLGQVSCYEEPDPFGNGDRPVQ